MGRISTLTKLALLFIAVRITCAPDTFVPEVQTLPTVTLISGKEATLTCDYNRTVYAVFWRYNRNSSPMELLVVRDEHYQVGKRSGPGYDEGRFDITDDFSLDIHKVKAQDEGKYICEVSDFTTGRVFRNHTDVIVYVLAKKPFIRIGKCDSDGSADEEINPCILYTTPDQKKIQLTCSVLGAKPKVTLLWMPSDSLWEEALNQSPLEIVNNSDGTIDQTLAVSIDISQFPPGVQHFTCVAEGFAVHGTANLTFGVHIRQYEGINAALIAVPIVVFILILTIAVVLRRKSVCRRQTVLIEDTDSGETGRLISEQEMKRREIQATIKERPINGQRIILGVLGDRGSGKSALIDSIISALKGASSDEPSHEERPIEPEEVVSLSDSIEIREVNEVKNGVRIRMKDILQPIGRGDDSSISNYIHCPILVYDIKKHKKESGSERSLANLSTVVWDRMMMYPILVLTHSDPSTDEDSISRRLSKVTRIPSDHLFVIRNSLQGNRKLQEDEVLQLLNIILTCTKFVQKGAIKLGRSVKRFTWQRNYTQSKH